MAKGILHFVQDDRIFRDLEVQSIFLMVQVTGILSPEAVAVQVITQSKKIKKR